MSLYDDLMQAWSSVSGGLKQQEDDLVTKLQPEKDTGNRRQFAVCIEEHRGNVARIAQGTIARTSTDWTDILRFLEALNVHIQFKKG